MTRPTKLILGASLVSLAAMLAICSGLIYLKRHAFRPPDQDVVRQQLNLRGTLKLMVDGYGRLATTYDTRFSEAEARQLRSDGVYSWNTYPVPPDKAPVLVYWMGGAELHYGVIVTGGDTPPNIFQTMIRWEDNVWYYCEIPLRD